MNVTVLIVGLLFIVLAMLAAAFFLGLLGSNAKGRGDAHSSMRTIVEAQRKVSETRRDKPKRASIFQTASESKVSRVVSSRVTLSKRLKFAQWKMPPLIFHLLEVGISLVAFSLVFSAFNVVIQLLTLATGPLFMRWYLGRAIEKRFKAFDQDYPSFLLSLVGLLKTGMNVMGALEAAAQGLEDGSLVKLEVELMIERLRFGVSEDKSIGSFGEDIYHPEIELFVQALLLSRRVGGTLSDTLDRLAKQVRKRQFFRASANAAVSMQRGSIWFIIVILACIEVYLYFSFPEAVTGAWADETGWQVWQTGILLILLGLFWVRQVTKIRT